MLHRTMTIMSAFAGSIPAWFRRRSWTTGLGVALITSCGAEGASASNPAPNTTSGVSAPTSTSAAPAPTSSGNTVTPASPTSNGVTSTSSTESNSVTSSSSPSTGATASEPTTTGTSSGLEASGQEETSATSPDSSTVPAEETATDSEGNTDAPNDFYPCDGANPADYDVTVLKSGDTWTVTKGSSQVYTGSSLEAALSEAYGALSDGRAAKETILVVGDGEISASSQLRIPSYTVVNVCGTVNVAGAASGSDRSPFYARGATQIDIPNLVLTGAPQYGLFFRETNDVHLGQIELRLTRDAGIGIRVDSGSNAGSSTTFNQNLTIDHVYGTGMGSHIVETYGIDGVKIGSVEGEDVGECGLLLNRSINAEVGSVTCTDCATGTGYAAFRVANSVGKVGNDFPDGNIHVGRVTARGGGRGIFSVSGCGGLVIDEIDIADTGSTAILMQNTYNTVIAAVSGTVSGGVVQLTNDTDNTNEGVYPPSKDVTLQNLTLTNGASVRQDWCNEFGSNGCIAMNITGGNVSMCE